MPNYSLCVEFFHDSEEGETHSFTSDKLYTHIKGYKLFKFTTEQAYVKDVALDVLKKLLSDPPEYIKASFPNFYKLSLTKQYWFHVFEDGYIKKNQVNEEPEFEAPSLSLEDHLKIDEDADGLLDVVDIFIDRDLNFLDAPPERIGLWEMLGLDDVVGD